MKLCQLARGRVFDIGQYSIIPPTKVKCQLKCVVEFDDNLFFSHFSALEFKSAKLKKLFVCERHHHNFRVFDSTIGKKGFEP